MSGVLIAVIKRDQIDGAVTPAQRCLDEMVGKCRVLREGWAVHIGPDGISHHAPFLPVLRIVAAASQDGAQRARPVMEVGTTAVVLEAHKHMSAPPDDEISYRSHASCALNRVEPDAGLGGPVNGMGIEDAESAEYVAACCLVEMTP